MSEKRKQNKRKPTANSDEQSQSKRLGKEMRSWPDKTDVLGSYTGMAEDFEPPVQDADDLRG